MPHIKESAVQALRRLAARPRLLPLTALLLRARTVRPSLAFAAREGVGRKGLFTYRLRQNGLRVAIRHGTGDVVTLGEIFHEPHYRPTAEIEQILTAVTHIVDLGANIGLFGAFAAARWPEAEILAFEPDPANAVVHERTIAMNGLQERWRLIRAAATARDGRAAFVAGEVALSHLADTGEDGQTIEVTAQDVVPHLAQVDLLKMDIEGGEWAILGDQRFRRSPPRALVLEYHPRFCPGADPRLAVEASLGEAGMQVQSIWHRDDGHGMLWAWRT
jgi:FkbM family methyltransferase